jgi:hypothetical protein
VLIAMNAQRAVAHHRIEPAAGAAAARIEAGRATPDPDKRVMHRLFRKILPKQDAAGDADHARRLAVVDHAQCGAVARRATRERRGKLRLALRIEHGGSLQVGGDRPISGHVYALA